MNTTNIVIRNFVFTHNRRLPIGIIFSAIAILLFGCVSATTPQENEAQQVAQRSNIDQLLTAAQQQQNAQVLFEKGNKLLISQKYTEAINLYDRALKINSNFGKVLVNRGNALTGLGKYKEAIASYNRAIGNNPQMSEAWFNRGNAFSSLQQYDEAITAYNRVIQIKPNQHEAWINKGIALAKTQKYADAIAAYEQSIQIKADKDLAYYNKACAYALQNQPELAIADLKKAMELAPGKYEQLAARDTDFRSLRNHQEFRALIPLNES